MFLVFLRDWSKIFTSQAWPIPIKTMSLPTSTYFWCLGSWEISADTDVARKQAYSGTWRVPRSMLLASFNTDSAPSNVPKTRNAGLLLRTNWHPCTLPDFLWIAGILLYQVGANTSGSSMQPCKWSRWTLKYLPLALPGDLGSSLHGSVFNLDTVICCRSSWQPSYLLR